MPVTFPRIVSAAVAALALLAIAGAGEARDAPDGGCKDGELDLGGKGEDIVIKKVCLVSKKGTYNYGNVNIIKGGALVFDDVEITFNAKSILIENGGSLIAGIDLAGFDRKSRILPPNPTIRPIGTSGGTLTIRLYGKDEVKFDGATNRWHGGIGIPCASPGEPAGSASTCGVPPHIWNSDGEKVVDPDQLGATPAFPTLPGGVTDRFYAYMPLPYDDGALPNEQPGYFGSKVLAVSYGGQLMLYGKKGASYDVATNGDSSKSGTSWARLDRSLAANSGASEQKVLLDRKVDWAAEDEIVVTTTDYLPGHSEKLRIKSVGLLNGNTELTVYNGTNHAHFGTKYSLSKHAGISRLNLGRDDVETRAAVALLSRSIKIVSDGATLGAPLPPETSADEARYFGGHTVVRQGAKKVQLQGVEFFQLGQGGRIGHYPVHFHMARKVPGNTWIRDNSVHDSMTRWYVVHATEGVEFARNVGYLSIGHGFYIEEGTETNNRYLSNIGIFARSAIDNDQNTRKVPGILAAPMNPAKTENVPFYSDVDHPSVFWIMNGWNDFEYNMAAGAGACGICYWLVPGANSGHSRHMDWTGYASLQADNSAKGDHPLDRAGITPLKRFVGNYCTTAQNSFNTVGNMATCWGIQVGSQEKVAAVPNKLAPPPCSQANYGDKGEPLADACMLDAYKDSDSYYPKVDQGGGRFATRCTEGTDCSNVERCSEGNIGACMITALVKYTSSYHWSDFNFAAIWLRPQWYLMVDSSLTDVQNGGITFVTGGGYTKSDTITGHWALARRNVFVGNTQTDNPYASNAGPFNPDGEKCDGAPDILYCLSRKNGVSFPTTNFAMNQRLFNIYDGPSYQEYNAYLDITKVPIPTAGCGADGDPIERNCRNSAYLGARALGMPKAKDKTCYLPNAAIGWKQPNGFYYPPAFRSNNLFFDAVDIRHYVLQPLFQPVEQMYAPGKPGGPYLTDLAAVQSAYCTYRFDMFNNWTDVDRQTELTDDDGSLTGYVNTISVNKDPFFTAPIETLECASEETVKTSPYDYVTSVVYPQCAAKDYAGGCYAKGKEWQWTQDCTNDRCYGVPMYRQLRTSAEKPADEAPFIRMAGQSAWQRSTLNAVNGVYYIDTTVSLDHQKQFSKNPDTALYNVFEPGKVYYTFMLFAKPAIGTNKATRQTYQMYVGKGFDPETDLVATQAVLSGINIEYKAVAWPSTWGVKKDLYDAKTGLLTVTMDMSFADFKTKYYAARKDKCKPQGFCQWTGDADTGSCGCAIGSASDPIYGYLYGACTQKNAQGKDAVCNAAINDVDCPDGGCYAFGVKMGSEFKYDPPPAENPRPKPPACFPSAPGAGWNVELKAPANPALVGACVNNPVNNLCSNP